MEVMRRLSCCAYPSDHWRILLFWLSVCNDSEISHFMMQQFSIQQRDGSAKLLDFTVEMRINFMCTNSGQHLSLPSWKIRENRASIMGGIWSLTDSCLFRCWIVPFAIQFVVFSGLWTCLPCNVLFSHWGLSCVVALPFIYLGVVGLTASVLLNSLCYTYLYSSSSNSPTPNWAT